MFVLGENHLRKCRCLVGPENRIFRKLISVDRKKKALTMEMNFRSYFHFKWIPERERERAREGEARTHQSASFACTELQSAPFASTNTVNRDLAPSIAISPLRRSRSREAARCFARLRSMVRSSDWSSRSTVPSNLVERQSGFCSCFSGFVFSFFFFKHQKIFFRKFLKMQPNTWKHFPFRKIAFLENGIFSENAFTDRKSVV